MLRNLSLCLLLVPVAALAVAGCPKSSTSGGGGSGGADTSSSSSSTGTSSSSGTGGTGTGGADGGDLLDAGLDTGDLLDAGNLLDAGDLLDAGLDAGDLLDAGLDAGHLLDGGLDGGLDAGLDASLDAGDGGAAVSLASAAAFTVLGGSTVTNTGTSTTIVGDLGVSPGTAITGLPAGVPTGGTEHLGDPVAAQAEADLTTAYNTLAGMPCDTILTGKDLAGMTLTPGVYCYVGVAGQLSGALTLDAQNNPDALFVIQIASTLTTTNSATVTLINGGQACNVYWQVGTSATIGESNMFAGNIVAFASITLMANTNLAGRALARTAAVTLDANNVAVGSCTH